MKIKFLSKYTKLQKLMFFIVPIIVLLLTVSIVMCCAFSFLPMPFSSVYMTGNLTMVFAGCSALLAVLGLVFAFFSKSSDIDDDN